jgi:glycosyltransferase involved in cell wall biosynthesis
MPAPVFGFLALTSGSLEGAIIRDMRLANELHRRGFKVVIYWMVDQNRGLVAPGIRQRMLCRGIRYHFAHPSGLAERLGAIFWLLPAATRSEFMQRHPNYVDRITTNFCRNLCDGVAHDQSVVRRLVRFMQKDGVTHLLPTFAMICPYARAAKARGTHPFEYLVTFQGEEIFANFAQRIERLDDYKRQLQECVAGSPWPAIAVSRDYADRLSGEMGIDAARMRTIYPGIEPPADNHVPPFEVLEPKFKRLNRNLPIVTFVGRQDSEKGIDLLLYAAKMLEQRGVKMQVVVCGGTSFGQRYREVIKSIAEHLRLPIHHRRRIPSEMRDALYAYSRCIVYPSIHREPFGMVAAEAMSHGTPVIVPDQGGIAEAIEIDGKAGGLTFKSWDSADLARQLERMLTDDSLHATLAANTRGIAENFTVARMADRVLEHIGVAKANDER